MSFIDIEDYKAVVDAQTLDVINQSDAENLQRAERYAIEEISSYLRSRFDVNKMFEATGDERNQQLVMITCDVALYHLIAWLPKRIGFEIRDIRYKRAIEWLETVQAGQATPDLPPLTDDTGADIGNPIKFGSMTKTVYDY
ncbi:MAG: DUF1320 domain-containing protein [Prevotellaceae bacterium]|jgi:phage gp36-like protein|nr:DUF1320 domain-containing protein [Prevotellaceae bacterium]